MTIPQLESLSNRPQHQCELNDQSKEDSKELEKENETVKQEEDQQVFKIEENKTISRRGRKKKSEIIKDEQALDIKENKPVSKRGRKKKTEIIKQGEQTFENKENKIASKRGRKKKSETIKQDEQTFEIKENKTISRRGRKKKLVTQDASKQDKQQEDHLEDQLNYKQTPQISSEVSKPLQSQLPKPTEKDFADIRKELHMSYLPDTLPCREMELMDIFGHLKTSIEENASGCFYIAGVPGTGKTTTVKKAISLLNEEVQNKILKPFDFLEINGMQLTDPKHVYIKLWEALGGDTVSASQALVCLREYFLMKRKRFQRKFWVILIDELDLLQTKSQSILYNLFEWPYHENSNLIIISIANTFDLPERMLSNKVTSRMGLIRKHFYPYTSDQLIEIVASRLKAVPWFHKDAIKMCSLKVSNVSGDIRRALDICRRAIELLELHIQTSPSDDKGYEVSIQLINKAIQEMYQSPTQTYLASLPEQQKIILIALADQTQRLATPSHTVASIYEYHRSLCLLSNWFIPLPDTFYKSINALVSLNFILCNSKSITPNASISLNILTNEVSIALSKIPKFKSCFKKE